MKKTFYANGKLFLMGEYTVLDGSAAFAVPTKQGQFLEVEPNGKNTVSWKSLDADGSVWLDAELSLKDIISCNVDAHADTAKMLLKVLHEAHTANPDVLQQGFDVVTKLTFPRLWGLGTSSTFIALVAEWFKIDAYSLLANTFGGSGYDIACAQHNTALVYTITQEGRNITTFDFTPAFTDNLYFVYLNKKQNSRDAIAAYRQRDFNRQMLAGEVNKLIEALVAALDLNTFASALEKQEALLAGVLGVAPVQEKLFPDFKGVVKSLGAWGGDFVMAASEQDPTQYFKDKGYETVVPWHDMIL